MGRLDRLDRLDHFEFRMDELNQFKMLMPCQNPLNMSGSRHVTFAKSASPKDITSIRICVQLVQLWILKSAIKTETWRVGFVWLPEPGWRLVFKLPWSFCEWERAFSSPHAFLKMYDVVIWLRKIPEDSSEWIDQLQAIGADFRFLAGVEAMCYELGQQEPYLNVIVNTACQTIRRPATYIAHLVSFGRGWSRIQICNDKLWDINNPGPSWPSFTWQCSFVSASCFEWR